MFGMNRAFRIAGTGDELEFCPINNADTITLSDLIGYELQKQELVRNTLAFCEGRKANDVLLYGDAGTGKSSSVKAVLNEYCSKGLRMIEIYKYQFRDLSNVIARIKKRNYKFIIFIDDLSFEEDEVEYKFLKAVIEGGVESRPDNVLIYATSNRRHLIKEMWKDKGKKSFPCHPALELPSIIPSRVTRNIWIWSRSWQSGKDCLQSMQQMELLWKNCWRRQRNGRSAMAVFPAGPQDSSSIICWGRKSNSIPFRRRQYLHQLLEHFFFIFCS